MERHNAKRVEIIIEAPMERRLTNTLTEAGVTGFTVLPVHGGSGRSGKWSREGQTTATMPPVICPSRDHLPERPDPP